MLILAFDEHTIIVEQLANADPVRELLVLCMRLRLIFSNEGQDSPFIRLSTPTIIYLPKVFFIVSFMGGLIGFAISFSSFWFLSQTTATIFSLVGALNKIPVAVVSDRSKACTPPHAFLLMQLGVVGFNEPTNPKNLASILIGLGAGVLFVRVKTR